MQGMVVTMSGRRDTSQRDEAVVLYHHTVDGASSEELVLGADGSPIKRHALRTDS